MSFLTSPMRPATEGATGSVRVGIRARAPLPLPVGGDADPPRSLCGGVVYCSSMSEEDELEEDELELEEGRGVDARRGVRRAPSVAAGRGSERSESELCAAAAAAGLRSLGDASSAPVGEAEVSSKSKKGLRRLPRLRAGGGD